MGMTQGHAGRGGLPRRPDRRSANPRSSPRPGQRPPRSTGFRKKTSDPAHQVINAQNAHIRTASVVTGRQNDIRP